MSQSGWDLRRVLSLLLLGVSLCLVGGCASLPDGHQADPRDPFERYNRAMFVFNSEVDEAVLKPVAQGYRNHLPDMVQRGIGNFFGNLSDMVTTVHHLLQGEGRQAGETAGRVLINTTIGILGLADPASDLGLRKTKEDFGQTFGRWGVEPGAYIMLPLLGPSTTRDTVGRVADFATDPFDQIFSVDAATKWGVRGTRVIDTRAGLLSVESTLDALSFDRYLSVRDAYLARRAQQVSNGASASQKDAP
ncbi:MAG: VacJ family lipoprotein [Burkholderiaceae bacterium]|jgi:phospholipid-binding lipoprotein MlaA|nr:VacJ family lipoprotein [Burkholderiaceae bacterium]